jgi:hypothetical protein
MIHRCCIGEGGGRRRRRRRRRGEGTLRKLNTSIFPMFTVEKSLLNHGNDRTPNGQSRRRESKMHLHPSIVVSIVTNLITPRAARQTIIPDY